MRWFVPPHELLTDLAVADAKCFFNETLKLWYLRDEISQLL